MYDDESEGEEGKVGKKVAQSVKRVARGTRRMSLMAADNVKNVAAGVQANVKKVTPGAGGGKKKKKKRKKKDKEKRKTKKRGRSESPKRSNNSNKPPVTKPGGLRSLFSPKRWRSASPAFGRSKKSKAVTEESEDEPDPVSPLPAFQNQALNLDSNTYDSTLAGMTGIGGAHLGNAGVAGVNGGMMTMNGCAGVNYSVHQQTKDAIGMSIRSMSSAARFQRNMQQEKIEQDNQVPFFSVLLQSEHFLKHCDMAFDLVDSNGDDAIDETELYAGLLLIHLKLGSLVGPAGCKPLSRECCKAMFQRFDANSTGGLDRTEFSRVMVVLFGKVVARVTVQYTLTILVVPVIAKRVLECLTWDSQKFWDYWTKPKVLRCTGAELTLDYFVDWNNASYPSPRRTFFTKLFSYFRLGSDEFWESFPLTFTTIVLGLVIAPFMLYYFDDFFQWAIDYKERRAKASSSRRRS